MKKTSLLFIFSLTIAWALKAQPNYSEPKLVVTIVVDQMRQDYIHRYWDLYGNDGFKKLVNDGFNFANAHFTYFPTYTAPGHANIGTGATPSVHGIVANAWYENATGKRMYCTSDDSVESVGTETRAGKQSPRNLKSTTFSDELRLAHNLRSRAFGISIKDRGAILPVGHLANAAYWLQATEGNFITSTYYMDELPSWVREFNEENHIDSYLNETWEPIIPVKELLKYTDIDDSPYENIVNGKESPTFPYNLKKLQKEKKNGKGMILATPFGNSLAFDFARALITHEKVGQTASGVPDFLSLSLSSPDYVGHSFAIRAMETADTYLRLDREIAAFLSFLEENIGKNEFILVLTADHGGADNPRYLKDRGYDVNFFTTDIPRDSLKKHLTKVYGDTIVRRYTNSQLYLDKNLIRKLHLDENEVIAEITDFMRFQPGVQRCITAEQLARGDATDAYLRMFQNGYDPARCGDIFIQLKPGWVSMSWSDRGTSHGSVYSYDTHVPMVFYGKNIPAGFTYKKTSPSNIAATFSALLGVTPPSGCTAEPLVHYFDR